MFKLLSCLLLTTALILNAVGSENALVTIYQPLESWSDEKGVVVRAVPFVTGGPFPEVSFQAITQEHIPQQSTPSKQGDINAASRAGISLSCDSLAAAQKKLLLVFDFTKAKPELLNEELIKALLQCIEKTAGKTIELRSKILGGENYPSFKKMIEVRIPPQKPRTTMQRRSLNLKPSEIAARHRQQSESE